MDLGFITMISQGATSIFAGLKSLLDSTGYGPLILLGVGLVYALVAPKSLKKPMQRGIADFLLVSLLLLVMVYPKVA